MDRSGFVGCDAGGENVLSAAKGGIRLLSLADKCFVAVTLLVMLTGGMIAAVGLPVRFVVARKVDVHVTALSAADAQKQKEI
jgi:hypothetical protein